MSARIEYSHSAANTRAFALIAEGWNELVQSYLTLDFDGLCPVTPDCHVLYAVSTDEDLVGVLAWNLDEKRGVITIRLAYVEPSSRRRRVFTDLFNQLVEHARKRGVHSIRMVVHHENEAAKAALGKVKAEPLEVVHEFAVA